MSEWNDWFEPATPSRQVALLRQMVGQRLTRLARFSLESPEELMRPNPDLDDDAPLKPHEVFSLAAGPLLLRLDNGLEIGFGSSDHSEIILDAKRLPDGRTSPHPYQEEGNFVLDAAEARFCRPEIRQMLGRPLRDVAVLKMDGAHFGKGRSFEVGLVIYVEQCPELILSANLTKGLDDFAVTLREEILPENRRYLTEERLAPAGS